MGRLTFPKKGFFEPSYCHLFEYYPGSWIFRFLPEFSDNYRYLPIYSDYYFCQYFRYFPISILILPIFSDIYRYFPISTEICPQMVPLFSDIYRYFPILISTVCNNVFRYLPIFSDFNLYKCCRYFPIFTDIFRFRDLPRSFGKYQ